MALFPLRSFVLSSKLMVTLHNTYGAFLIGVVVAAVLYGCICIQAWYYYTHYSSDWWYIKLLVAGVLVFETCHQALIMHTIYTYLITQFGDPEGLDRTILSPIVAIFFSSFTTLSVQSFLVIRVYRLSKKNWLATGLTVIMVTTQLAMAFAVAIEATSFHTIAQLSTLKTLTTAMNATVAAGDLFIALLLCSLLQTSRTGFRRSDTMIDRLIMFSINTGLLTSLCAIASLICVSVWPHTFIYMAFYLNIGRLYSNSFLVALNMRKGLSGESHNESLLFVQESHRMTNRSKLGRTTSRRAPTNISIEVNTTHEFIRDEYSDNGDMKNPEVV